VLSHGNPQSSALSSTFKVAPKPPPENVRALTTPHIDFHPFTPIIDDIDGKLACHYGFTGELDFGINEDSRSRLSLARE
jgi:hypothetical protein